MSAKPRPRASASAFRVPPSAFHLSPLSLLLPYQLRWVQDDQSGTANDKTLVMGDLNGDRIGDFVLEITGLHTMRAVDFLL